MLTKTKKGKTRERKQYHGKAKLTKKNNNALIACYNDLKLSIHTCELRYFRFCSKISCPVYSIHVLSMNLLRQQGWHMYFCPSRRIPTTQPLLQTYHYSNNTQMLICQTYPQVNAMLICNLNNMQYGVIWILTQTNRTTSITSVQNL